MKKTHVHSTRHNGGEVMEVEITKEALHHYGWQCETAIYAKPLNGGRGKWYVGYGGDYIPANRGDMDNMEQS